jgi:rubrerythrin
VHLEDQVEVEDLVELLLKLEEQETHHQFHHHKEIQEEQV